MVNILIVEDNFYYLKSLVNIISNKISEARIYKILTDGEEALDVIKKHSEDIDIIILDLSLPKQTGIDICNYIKKNKLIKFENSIIVISGYAELIVKLIDNKYLYNYLNKTTGIDRILSSIKTLSIIKEKEKNSVEYNVKLELRRLNYNFSYKGTKYIFEAIMLLCNNNDKDVVLEKNIYSKIAQKYRKTVNNIKTNILNATTGMYFDCDENTLHSYFGLYGKEKPTPKEIICTIVDKVKYPK